jgi:formamidopyrimidine-DNA glycosylase
MPELAELALFAQDIRRKTEDSRLLKVEFPEDKWSAAIVPEAVRKSLKKAIKRFPKFASYGKTLIMEHGDQDLAIKLGMTGRFSTGASNSKHTFVRMFFENGTVIEHQDPRRFGRWNTISDEDYDHLKHNCLGWYDPGDMPNQFSALRIQPYNRLLRMVSGYRRVPAITWLLKNGPTTGVGNYLANEALGILNINPFEPIRADDADEEMHTAAELLQVCGEVAKESFAAGGNSFAGGYFRLDGAPGSYESQCQFYQAEGIPRYSFRGRPVYTRFQPPC